MKLEWYWWVFLFLFGLGFLSLEILLVHLLTGRL
jgi:hypothetical protein